MKTLNKYIVALALLCTGLNLHAAVGTTIVRFFEDDFSSYSDWTPEFDLVAGPKLLIFDADNHRPVMVTLGANLTYNYQGYDSPSNTYYGEIKATSAARSFGTRTPTLNSAFQISTTRDCFVSYPVDVGVTSLLLAGTQGTVTLQYADNVGMSTNLVTVCSGTNATGGVLNVTNSGTVLLTAVIPTGKYVRITTANTTGTPTFTARQGQEVLE